MNLLVATYLWSPDPGSKFAHAYTVGDVRTLQRMVKANLTLPHQFACITDTPDLFAGDPDIRAIPIDRSKHVKGTCFLRLMTFHPDGQALFGADRLFQMDLDTLIVGNIDHIVDRPEEVVLWRNPARIPWDNPAKPSRPYYNSSFVLHKLGSLPFVWREFDPDNPGCRDDQWWLAQVFGPDAPYWDQADGIYRIARPGEPETGIWGEVPANACLVTMPGSEGKPSNPVVRAANPWLAEYGA